jgi:AraC family transcriptional activator of tynA and feaB
MEGSLSQSISAAHRRFTSPDEWLSTIERHFLGSRYTRRRHPFSMFARLENLAGSLVLDSHVSKSGLDGGEDSYGFSIEAVEFRPYFALWQQTGLARVRQAGRTVELKAGEWALFDASIPTSFLVPDDSRTIGLSLSYGNCGWSSSVPAGGVSLRRTVESRIASAILLEALRCSEWLVPEFQASVESVLIDAIEASLIPTGQLHCAGSSRAKSKVDRARQAIEGQLANPDLSPEDIGRAIGLSRRSLYRLFHQLGQTPMGYVHQLRLEEAARRFRDKRTEDRSVTSVSYAVGFADPTHFSRLFKARYGMSPREWTAARTCA